VRPATATQRRRVRGCFLSDAKSSLGDAKSSRGCEPQAEGRRQREGRVKGDRGALNEGATMCLSSPRAVRR
jgi:hypothetical protein